MSQENETQDLGVPHSVAGWRWRAVRALCAVLLLAGGLTVTQLVTTSATRSITVDGRVIEVPLPWYSYHWSAYTTMFVISMPFAAFLIIGRTVWGFLAAGLVPSRGEVIPMGRRVCTGVVKEAMIILPVTLYGLVFNGAQFLFGSVDARRVVAFVYVGLCSLGAGFLGRGWTIRGVSLPRKLGILALAALWAVISVGTIIGFRLPQLRYLPPVIFYRVLALLGRVQGDLARW